LTTTLARIWDQLRPAGLRFSSVGGYGDFEVRAEVPGVDPARDIRIWLAGGVLRVEVTRAPTRDDQTRSEFHYGRLFGAVDLPSDVDVRRLSARYHRGVLRIASAAGGAPGTAVAIRPKPYNGVTSRQAFRDFRP
jgi:HSP20 family protein